MNDAARSELINGALQVTHITTEETEPDVKSILTNDQYLKQAERRKIACAVGSRRIRQTTSENKTANAEPTNLEKQLAELAERLDRQRQMMNILLILSMFQLFIFACTLITARGNSNGGVAVKNVEL